jgi:hypothetical protein
VTFPIGCAGAVPTVDLDELLRRIAVEFDVSMQSAVPVRGGQDSSATVWRGLLTDGSSVAIKATRRASGTALLVQGYLAASGVPGIVAPLLTREARRISSCSCPGDQPAYPAKMRRAPSPAARTSGGASRSTRPTPG